MNIALIGYGKMGKAIEKIVLKKNHTIVARVTKSTRDQINNLKELNTDVAIEFSNPQSAVDNIKKCIEQSIPVVTGTTGWEESYEEVKKFCIERNGTMFHAANFSIGVNIFFRINKYLASIMNSYDEYSVSIEETHHIHKKDSPSGTAITLANEITQQISRLNDWGMGSDSSDKVTIKSHRINETPGTHVISYKNDVESIELKHEAKNREGFANGAVLVSEWIVTQKGFLTMNDFLDL